MKRIVLMLLVILSGVVGKSQEVEEGHHDHKNEIGIANSPVYFVNEAEFSYGFHAHYVRAYKETSFGYGLGYEHIFDEHKHNTVSLVAAYRYKEFWNLIASPGVTFEENNFDDPRFSLHIEASYEYELGDFHIGPAFEVAYDPEDYHISLGLHVGYCF